MNTSRRIMPQVGLLFVLGALGLSKFSHGVRAVDVVGLSGAGCAIGVGFALTVLSLRGRIGR